MQENQKMLQQKMMSKLQIETFKDTECKPIKNPWHKMEVQIKI